VSRDDDLLGGMSAVLATIFVLRDSFGKSVAAGVSRMSATLVSFVFCLIYLAFLPFHAWALAVLVGASALAVMLLGRPGDAVTAGITTAVILVVAAVSPSTRGSSPFSAWPTPSSASPSAWWPPGPAYRSRGSCPLDLISPPRPRPRSIYPNGPWWAGRGARWRSWPCRGIRRALPGSPGRHHQFL
jgi:hypothetical protein